MSTAPQYASSHNAGTPATLTAANTATDGTGSTGRALIFTAEAVSNGQSCLPIIRFIPLGTGVKTNLRVFLNNGSDPEVAGNNALIAEVSLPAATIDHDDPSLFAVDLALREFFGDPGLMLKGHATTPERVYVVLATAHAAGIKITPINGANFS